MNETNYYQPEKKVFKFRNGFVNIDSEAVYFSESGNWQEVNSYTEYSDSKVNFVQNKKAQLLINLVTGASILYNADLDTLQQINFLPLLLWGIICIMIFITSRLLSYTKFNLKIPINKISKIDVDSDKLKIDFLDINLNEQKQTVRGLSAMGSGYFNLLRDKMEAK